MVTSANTEQVTRYDEEKRLGNGWQFVRFDQMAECITDRVDNPSEADVEYYVGLEHLDSESLKIRRWGTPNDVEATKLRFKPGDIIFGKRRAYQRKIAVAEFEGICSAHALVLRAREETVLKEFLPFFMQSEPFFERAISISVGSLSPTINWKTLAQQKFVIPPKDEQRGIADILWAADDISEKLENVLKAQEQLQNNVMKVLFSKGLSSWHTSYKPSEFGSTPIDWQVKPISEVAEVTYGISEAVASNKDPSIGVPILTSANINIEGQLDLFKLNYIEEPNKDSFRLKKGDLLLNWRSGSPEHVGKTAIFDADGTFTYASFLLKIRVKDSMNNIFLHRFLNFMRRNKLFGSATSQQVNFKMNAAMFRDVLVVVPSFQEQSEIAQIFLSFDASLASTKERIRNTKSLKKALMEYIL